MSASSYFSIFLTTTVYAFYDRKKKIISQRSNFLFFTFLYSVLVMYILFGELVKKNFISDYVKQHVKNCWVNFAIMKRFKIKSN